MKLELKHLAPYLPYGLKLNLNRNQGMYVDSNINILRTEICYNETVNEAYIKYDLVTYGMEDIKPILRPLSDLTKDKKVCSTYMVGVHLEDMHINRWEWNLISYCFENHFDVFGLIEKGLAIDVNTI